MTEHILFESWGGILRVLVTGTLAYGALVVLLRISGKRTLSKMNAFDFVVTVALGSTLATILLNKQMPVLEGVAALALLIALQFVITWLSVRSDWVKHIAKSEPSLLLRDGILLNEAMHRERVTAEEIDAAIRESGAEDRKSVSCVVLESDGSLSVIRQ
jgi:uncharacterized membrane protein YcaP (DUF421 family)